MADELLTPEEIAVKVWNMACAVANKPSNEYQTVRTHTLEWARDEVKTQLAKAKPTIEKAERERIYAAVEKYKITGGGLLEQFNKYYIVITDRQWQALKEAVG